MDLPLLRDLNCWRQEATLISTSWNLTPDFDGAALIDSSGGPGMMTASKSMQERGVREVDLCWKRGMKACK